MTNLCRVCRETIQDNAKKCPHCASFQSWRVHLPFSQTIIALLVALISVISMGLPIIKDALTADNADVSFSYIDRADTTVPIIASNKGSRPGVMSSKAGLKLLLTDHDGKPHNHIFLLSAADRSRGNLLIPEGTSKQFFFSMDFTQPIPDAFSKLAADIEDILSLKKCTFTITHLDFLGSEKKAELVIFDAEATKWIPTGDGGEMMAKILAASECLGKIPQPIRQQYNIQ